MTLTNVCIKGLIKSNNLFENPMRSIRISIQFSNVLSSTFQALKVYCKSLIYLVIAHNKLVLQV